MYTYACTEALFSGRKSKTAKDPPCCANPLTFLGQVVNISAVWKHLSSRRNDRFIIPEIAPFQGKVYTSAKIMNVQILMFVSYYTTVSWG